jgi:hypothetical protein
MIKEITNADCLKLRKYSGYIYWFGIWSIIWSLSQFHMIYRSYELLPADEKTWQSIAVMLISSFPLWIYALGLLCAWKRQYLCRLLGIVVCACWLLILISIFLLKKSPQIEEFHQVFFVVYIVVLIRSLIGFVLGKRLFGIDRWTHSELVSECNRRMIK